LTNARIRSKTEENQEAMLSEPLTANTTDAIELASTPQRSRVDTVVAAPAHSKVKLAGDHGKFGNAFLRWSLLYALIVACVGALPLYLPVFFKDAYHRGLVTGVANGAVLGFISLAWLAIAFFAYLNFTRLGTETAVPLAGLKLGRRRRFKHIVVVPCYLDPIEILLAAIVGLLLARGC
jgi:hypothetical protein